MDNPVIKQLETMLHEQHQQVEDWLNAAFERTPASFYSSVDIRHAGFKLAPVDTNLFPAGFNHLSAPSQARAIELMRAYLKRLPHPVERVMVIPENHTRNLGYLDNLQALVSLLERAGCEVRIGSLQAEEGECLHLEDSSGKELVQQPLQKEGTILKTSCGFTPDVILMNNDMTAGSPPILRGVTQTIIPAVGQGWYRRKKTIHFEAYGEVAHEFAAAFGLDPWLLRAEFHQCGRINFRERKGIECVALGVEKVLRVVRERYAQYGISEEPYVFIKADSGTYGMGIMTVRSGEEVFEMNKKNRNKMNAIKEGVQTTEVIIQEGVPTADVVDGGIAEPMVYLVDGHPVGGAFRINEARDTYNNLNAAGMRFVPMCEDASAECMKTLSPLGLVARLATLAASREEYGDDYVI
jgi:glutamate--cysteine ligase